MTLFVVVNEILNKRGVCVTCTVLQVPLENIMEHVISLILEVYIVILKNRRNSPHFKIHSATKKCLKLGKCDFATFFYHF